MSRPTVVIAESIAAAGVDRLREHCDVVDVIGGDRSAVIEAVAEADGLVVRSATQVDAEMLAAASRRMSSLMRSSGRGSSLRSRLSSDRSSFFSPASTLILLTASARSRAISFAFCSPKTSTAP